MMKSLLPVVPLVLLSVTSIDVQRTFADDDLSLRWVYVQTNLQVTENADRLLVPLLQQSTEAGQSPLGTSRPGCSVP